MTSNKTSMLTNNIQDYTSQIQDNDDLGSCKDASSFIIYVLMLEEGMAADYDRRSCHTSETFKSGP
jgi:hypothetical protein